MERNKNKHPSALSVDQLTVNYDKTPVLFDISMEIPKGVLVGIIGPNGAGKSTFIKTAMDLVKPLSGKVNFFGKPLKSVRQQVAYVPQRESVDWDFPITVKDLVLMGRYGKLGLFKRPRSADVEAALHYLERVGMSAFVNRQISQLSGGQQQRVFIARALMQEADLYFMDEPFAGIDMATEGVIIELLKQLKDKGKTVFVVHHDLSSIGRYFDWVIMLNVRLVAYGEVSKVYNVEHLTQTYGRNYSLFDEALKLSQQKNTGMV